MGSSKYPKDLSAFDSEDSRNDAVEKAVHDIQEALGPFRHRQGDETRSEQESLRRLVIDTASLGWRLFSQSQVTELFWSDSANVMEVFPGVRRITVSGEGGRQIIVIQEPSCH